MVKARKLRVLGILTSGILASCSGEPPAAPPATLDLAHQVATVVEGSPAELEAVVTVINVGEQALRLEYGCGAVRLLVFRSADRSGRPAWDSDHRVDAFGNGFACPAYLATHVLEPGESFSAPEFRYAVPVREVLGDSLPKGATFLGSTFA